MTDRLRPALAGANAVLEAARAVGDGVVEFFRVLPSAVASGAADTMLAHGRDPEAGLSMCFDFDALDDDEAMRLSRESYSYFQAISGIYPTEPQHLGLYEFVRMAWHESHR